MCAEAYHEPIELIGEDARDYHRAIVSMIEEFQAIDWYFQRVTATKDTELRDILKHNMDEEKEHAAMLLEYLRRRDEELSEELEEYLFSKGDIAKLEEED